MAARLLSRSVRQEFITVRYANKPYLQSLLEIRPDRSSVTATRAMGSTAKKNQQERCVTIDNMNEHIKVMEYAVRGPLVIRANEIVKELEQVCILYITFN